MNDVILYVIKGDRPRFWKKRHPIRTGEPMYASFWRAEIGAKRYRNGQWWTLVDKSAGER